MNLRRLVALVRDRIELARLRHAIRATARNPFDGARQRAADDRSLTANCALDEQPAADARPGSDHQALADLNRIYDAPSWKGQR